MRLFSSSSMPAFIVGSVHSIVALKAIDFHIFVLTGNDAAVAAFSHNYNVQ
jgi:Zn/Cd-binding protein ZinT